MAKYNDIYPNTLEGTGLVFGLSIMPDIPWSAITIEDKQSLEMAYGMRSGFKTMTTGFVAADDAARVRILMMLFREKWQKLWDVFRLEYNPLDAYKVVEEGGDSKTVSVNKITTFGKTVSESGTNSEEVISNETNNNNGTENIYGLSSGGYGAPANSSNEESRVNGTESRDAEKSSEITHGGSDSSDMSETEQIEHRLTKSGNIGYTSPQSLLKQEFELWKEPYFNIVFADIDSFFTVQVYDV